MELGLQNKTALVTASTAGIGFACADLLAKEGATVYVNGRTEARVREAIQKIASNGSRGKLIPLVQDCSTKQGIQAVIHQIPSVDILVNNLGYYKMKEFEEITDEEWLDIFNCNVMTGIALSRHFLPKMKENKWGRIVFISSESAINIPREMIHYGLTKTAQLSLTQGLAQNCKGTGVTVNSILPGPTYTEGVKNFIEEMAKSRSMTVKQAEAEFFKTMRSSSLIQRFATPDEVASLVTFICSETAAAITGAALRVDGGCVRSIV